MREILIKGRSLNLILNYLSSSIVHNRTTEVEKFRTTEGDIFDFEMFVEKIDRSMWHSESFSDKKPNLDRYLILTGTMVSKEKKEYNNRKCKIKIYSSGNKMELRISTDMETQLIRLKDWVFRTVDELKTVLKQSKFFKSEDKKLTT